MQALNPMGSIPLKLTDLYDMGNICTAGRAGQARREEPPHTLEELVSQVTVTKDVKEMDLEQIIMDSPWANRFRQYLRNRSLEDDENILKFLVMVQPLKFLAYINNNDLKILGHSKLHGPVITEEEQKRLFLRVVDTFLAEESEALLPLSNQALWADLTATASSIRSGLPVSKQALAEICEVRRDPGIWDQGIEPTYFRFLKQVPPPSLAACILSIL